MNKFITFKNLIIPLSTLIVGGILGWIAASYNIPMKSVAVPVEVREDSSEYTFINPLIYSRVSKDFYTQEFTEFNFTIKYIIDDNIKNHKAEAISVYFRDLNNGHWTGLNENQTYEPSSMLKVVLMIAYLKDSVNNPEIMSKMLYYKGLDEAGQYYKSKHQLTPGYYKVQDLIEAMIVDSDNVATASLIQNNEKEFNNVYKDFRLPAPPTDPEAKDYMSARSYSVVFRSLYNSTYLPRNLSEQALSLLSKSNFTSGLVAGVAPGTTVSQKFGEHTYFLPSGLVTDRELHDCGIIYYPDHPYLLCVMTKGYDFPSLEKVISSISKDVYAYVDKNAKK